MSKIKEAAAAASTIETVEATDSVTRELQFLRPVGTTVPGGPFNKDGVYSVGPDTFNHPLIVGMIGAGLIRELGGHAEEDVKIVALKDSVDQLTEELEAAKKELEAAKKELAAGK